MSGADMSSGDMSSGDDRDRRDILAGGRHDWHGDDVADGRTAELLRHALSREAAKVNPSGAGLQAIRARTTRVSRRPAWLLPVAAAAASAAVIGGIGWATSFGDTEAPFASEAPTAPTADPSIGPDPTDEPTGPDQPTVTPEGTAVAIPVYYVGRQPPEEGGSEPQYKLFREYHPIRVDAAPDLETRVELALAEMFASSPVDPDYEGGSWRADASVRSVDIDETNRTITVDLTGVDPSDSTDGEGPAAAAVQQLVFTVTAAAAYDGFAPETADILVDGARVDELFGTDVSAPLKRDTVTFFAPIQILSFTDGDTLTNPVTVTGLMRYDGTTPAGEPPHGPSGTWQVLQGDSVVAEGGITPETCCGWEPYEFMVDDLPPGGYVLKVFDSYGSAPELAPYDTKNFNIEGPAE